MPSGDGTLGRKIVLTWNGAAIEGVREKGIALAGEPINVSDDDSDGWRELLSEVGENTVDISLSGVIKSTALKVDWFAGTRTRAVVITYPDGSIIAGDFMLASYNETGPYADATTFEGALQSTGEITYTPGP
jgi:predicted secreted protein